MVTLRIPVAEQKGPSITMSARERTCKRYWFAYCQCNLHDETSTQMKFGLALSGHKIQIAACRGLVVTRNW